VNTIVGGSTNTPTDLLLLGIDQSSATDNAKVEDDDDAGSEGCPEDTPGGGGEPTRM
jgi:hypothetical protein